ncbi:hypothetical protein MIND_00096800 [Mycena indigotica]|uniref:Uncharacterized protein n=1 Tax=Mycena indigotica TaxID=2126181 RepID=A0A8H6TFL5_9AGAR|nr:uncharacterized protein MIND_00096800 [Mycena indigotica]KAF7315807.1 hypothetical protein MIND_00096800 [Mycena indigotica]
MNRALLILLSFTATLARASVDFATCINQVRNGTFGHVGGTDNKGNPVQNISDATAVTYDLCLKACGAGAAPFVWNIFSQQFSKSNSAWLLPFLALMAQLPFGATDKLDNVVAVLLSVGSPTLAAYSLALTVLNGHWIARRFSQLSYPNVRYAIQILSRLQQTPIRIISDDALLASLVVLPENDKWWAKLVHDLEYTHTWTISSVASILWVTVAFLFTVVDSFTGTIDSSTLNANGQGVGSIYLWLLPIVIGWLLVGPKCDSFRLHHAVESVNELAFVATDKERPSPAQEVEVEFAISLKRHSGPVLRDEQCSPPIYNYARFLPWVQAVNEVFDVFEAAAYRANKHDSVDPEVLWQHVRSGKVQPNNRRGTRIQVEEYVRRREKNRSRWGPQVFSRFFVASLLALMLTWSTTGAAVIIVWFTPTVGLGCRSGAYVLYGAMSTIVWVMLVTSSALAHYSDHPTFIDEDDQPIYSTASRLAANISIVLRRLGKLLAAVNAVWIVLTCILQFVSFFDRCYCDSSVLGLGRFAYNVIDLVPGDISTMKTAWGGAILLAGGCSLLFLGWVKMFVDPPLPAE